MESEIIQKAGLSAPQAKTYLALVQNGALSPAKIAAITEETRSNTYALLEKLEKLKLVKKLESPKTSYEAVHPSSLEILATKRRRLMTKNEQELKANISPLIDLFYAHNETPGVRTLYGVDGIKETYEEELLAKCDTYVIRSIHDTNLGHKWWHDYRDRRAKAGIKTYIVTPDTSIGRENEFSGRNKQIGVNSIFMPTEAYTAPVAIDIFGDKTALITFGKTQMATIIDSPMIAEAFRQIWKNLAKYHRGNYK